MIKSSPGRILAFDFGLARIGVAASDLQQLLAAPVSTLKNDEHLFIQIQELLREIEPIFLVVGNPSHLSGKPGTISLEIKDFVTNLKKNYQGEIYLVDERFSSSVASNQLRSAGISTRKQKQKIDQQAAVNILNFVLACQVNKKSFGNLA